MKITYLKNEQGASRFGNCNECAVGSDEEKNLRRIALKDTCFCLCPKCFSRLLFDMEIIQSVEEDE